MGGYAGPMVNIIFYTSQNLQKIYIIDVYSSKMVVYIIDVYGSKRQKVLRLVKFLHFIKSFWLRMLLILFLHTHNMQPPEQQTSH